MDEEQGGSRRPSPSTFWDFSPLRSLFSTRATPGTPSTPEIIVTTCSSETIVSGVNINPGSVVTASDPVSVNPAVNTASESESLNASSVDGQGIILETSCTNEPTDAPPRPLVITSDLRNENVSLDQAKPCTLETHTAIASTSGVLLNPLLLENMPKSTLRLPKAAFRKRSSSYSDLTVRPRLDDSESDQDTLPELSAHELRLILMKNSKRSDKKQQEEKEKYISQLNEILQLPENSSNRKSTTKKSNSDELIGDSSGNSTPSGSGVVPKAGLGAISTGLLPAASVASLLDNAILGVKSLQTRIQRDGNGSNSGSQYNSSLPRMRSRPRLLSHPEFTVPDSIQTAPISSAKRFFIPPYFRRPSQLSTVS